MEEELIQRREVLIWRENAAEERSSSSFTDIG
jgi:hypothetical protein